MHEDGRKLSREVQESYRLRAITLRENMGYSVQEISRIFGVRYESASRWFVQYRRGGTEALRQHKAKGKIQTLKSDDLKWLERVLQDSAIDHGFLTPLWTGTSVRILFQKERKINLDRTTIWRYLIRLGLSFQKPEKQYSQQDKKLVKQWIDEEWPEIQKWARQNHAVIYFEDGT
jgi:transposase